MALPKVTQDTWNTLEPAMHNFQPKTKELAYLVVVKGIEVSLVAKEQGLSRQTVYEAVWRFASILEQSEETKLVPVFEWLPEDMAKEVRKMAEPFKKKINRT